MFSNAAHEIAYQTILRMMLDGGVKLRLGSCVDEKTAAELMGYASADTLRKRVAMQINTTPYKRVGNRRFYDLKDIAKVWAENNF